MTERSNEYRARAKYFRDMAEQSKFPDIADQYQRLARGYDDLADQVDRDVRQLGGGAQKVT